MPVSKRDRIIQRTIHQTRTSLQSAMNLLKEVEDATKEETNSLEMSNLLRNAARQASQAQDDLRLLEGFFYREVVGDDK